MDEGEFAEAAEQRDRDLCLSIRKKELKPTGACYWCSETCRGVFCSPECREDHEQEQRFKGKPNE